MANLAHLHDGVAVLTGSASGLGYAMAVKCCRLHMKTVVLSDLRPQALSTAVATLSQLHPSTTVVGIVCDVSQPSSVQHLLTSIRQRFPQQPIRFLSANAGILFPKSTILSGTDEEWALTYRVNVLGLASTLKVFTNHMMQQQGDSCIEITASSAGVVNGGLGPYGTSKHAALAIAEGLHGELMARGMHRKIHMVVLCPAIVETALLDSSFAIAQQASGNTALSTDARENDAASVGTVSLFHNTIKSGMSAEFCAERVFQSLEKGEFYCILDNDVARDGFCLGLNEKIGARAVAMLTGGAPNRTRGGKL